MRRLLAVALAIGLGAACTDDHVTIAFRPNTGARYHYDATVESSTVSQLPGAAPQATKDSTHLHSDLRVIDASGDEARLEVVLAREGAGARTYVMRFDRAAQLTQVESIEGIPAEALGPLGLTEIFPAAAGAPPDRPLRPGDRWSIDDQVQLDAGAPPSRLSGSGRLRELGVIDGRRTATVVSSTSLPLHSVSNDATSRRTLDGVQSTELTVTYDLDDGAVAHVSAVTTARYSVTFEPPAGQQGAPVVGSLTVVVRSQITRR